MRSKIEAYRRYRASGQEQGAHDSVFPLMLIVTTRGNAVPGLGHVMAPLAYLDAFRGFDPYGRGI